MPYSHFPCCQSQLTSSQGIMRSLTSCQTTNMKQLFWISFLLAHLPGTESKDKAGSCLSQPDEVIWHKIGQNAVLPCSVASHCSDQDLHFVWFVFKENDHHRLSLTDKYSLRGSSLHISSLHSNDSGIYHCAVESRSPSKCCQQHVGTGTTLVVKKKIKIMVRNILLWTSFALLVVYSLAIVTLILKKYGYMKVSTRMSKFGKKNSKKTSQFRDVLQELHSRGNLKKSKKTKGNHSQVEAASGECSISSEDIYQNV